VRGWNIKCHPTHYFIIQFVNREKRILSCELFVTVKKFIIIRRERFKNEERKKFFIRFHGFYFGLKDDHDGMALRHISRKKKSMPKKMCAK
jgi:hypothetical protein